MICSIHFQGSRNLEVKYVQKLLSYFQAAVTVKHVKVIHDAWFNAYLILSNDLLKYVIFSPYTEVLISLPIYIFSFDFKK